MTGIGDFYLADVEHMVTALDSMFARVQEIESAEESAAAQLAEDGVLAEKMGRILSAAAHCQQVKSTFRAAIEDVETLGRLMSAAHAS